jgi:Fe-S oxidoreductase
LFNPGKVIPDISHWDDYLRRGLAYRGREHPEKLTQESNLREASGLESGLLLFTEPAVTEPTRIEPDDFETKTSKNFSSQIESQITWEPQHIFESVHLCNGCGECFRNDSRSRMCPMFRNQIEEAASPRAKANLLRGVLEGELELETLTQDNAKEVADTCFHCGMCSIECPSGVDVTNLAFRCQSAYAAAHGLSLEDRFLSQADTVLHLLAMISCPVNWATSNSFFRWLLEKFLQIPQGRMIPKLAKVTFLAKNLARSQWSNWLTKLLPVQPPRRQELSSVHWEHSGNRVALFVDTFANCFDTKLADLAVRILRHNGFSVYVPPRQRPSGSTSFAVGHRDRAERLAQHNSLLFADLIRQDYHVVTLEPASASCLARDYRMILDDIDTALVSSHVVDFCEFLMQQHRRGKLRLDFVQNSVLAGKSIGYHAPCQSIVRTSQCVDLPTPAESLLHLIPELRVRRIEQGCCGMAGSFGFKRKNYRRSLRIGVALFKELRQPEIDFGVSDCSACCLQMEQGSRKKTFHPIRLLAAAYGFTPEIFETKKITPELNNKR